MALLRRFNVRSWWNGLLLLSSVQKPIRYAKLIKIIKIIKTIKPQRLA
jgi:hypothetical protein